MIVSTEPFGLPDDAPELARRFAVIMAGLGALVAARFLRMPHLSGFTLLLYGRLNRAVRRFHRALTQPPQVRVVRARVAAVRVRSLELPRGRGWIVRELGWEAAAFMGYLENLLAEIATQMALAGVPRAGRILRPVCRMLGVSAAVTPKMVPKVAATPEVVRRLEVSEGSKSPHPGPFPPSAGEGEGEVSVSGRSFPKV